MNTATLLSYAPHTGIRSHCVAQSIVPLVEGRICRVYGHAPIHRVPLGAVILDPGGIQFKNVETVTVTLPGSTVSFDLDKVPALLAMIRTAKDSEKGLSVRAYQTPDGVVRAVRFFGNHILSVIPEPDVEPLLDALAAQAVRGAACWAEHRAKIAGHPHLHMALPPGEDLA